MLAAKGVALVSPRNLVQDRVQIRGHEDTQMRLRKKRELNQILRISTDGLGGL
jgi:hypothetical protein